MKMLNKTVQIAGIKSLSEARLLIDCGVDLLGFPLFLEDNPQDLDAEEAAEIIKQINNRVSCSVITYLNNHHKILDLCTYTNVKIVQLHGDIPTREIRELKTKAPYLTLIKSLIIGKHEPDSLKRQISELEPYCGAFITDTYDPQTGASGATGKRHDLNISRELIEFSGKPVIIAGGLTPENVYQSILFARPAAVDAHTGVEDSEGNKSSPRVESFVENARKGFSAL